MELQRENPENVQLAEERMNEEQENLIADSQVTEMTEAEHLRQTVRKQSNAETVLINKAIEITCIKAVEHFNIEEFEEKNEKILQKIKQTQLRLSKCTLENKDLEKVLDNEKDDISVLSSRVKNTGDIINGLKEFVSNVQKDMKKLNFEEQSKKFTILHSKISQRFEEHKKINDCLLKKKRDLESLIENGKIDKDKTIQELNNRIMELKRIIVEGKNELNILEGKCSEEYESLEKQKEENGILENKRNEMLVDLENEKKSLEEAEELLSKTEQENKVKEETLREELKCKRTVLHNLQLNNETVKQELNDLNDNIKIQNNVLLEIEENNKSLEENIKLAENMYEEKKQILETAEIKLKDNLKNLSDKFQKAEETFNKTKAERRELKQKLNSLKADYFTSIEQKASLTSKLLVLKETTMELKKKVALQEMISSRTTEKLQSKNSNLKELEQSIKQTNEDLSKETSNFNSKIEEIDKQLIDFEDEHKSKIEELSKDQEYGLASSNYLNDKLKSIKESVAAITEHNREEQTSIFKIDAAIEMKKTRLEQWNAYLNKLTNSAVPKSRDITGILKSPGKSQGISPKKVKFQGIPSSDGSSQEVQVSVKNKTFDDWIELLKQNDGFLVPESVASAKRQKLTE